LADEPLPTPAPPKIERPLPPFEDDVARWKRLADIAELEREQNRAELRRQQHEGQISGQAAIDVLTAQISALRHDLDTQAEAANEQARALIVFGTAVETKMTALEALAARLDRTLEAMRDAREAQTATLRNQLDLVSRQNEFLEQQMATARHEINRTDARRARDRANTDAERIATNVRRLDLTLSR